MQRRHFSRALSAATVAGAAGVAGWSVPSLAQAQAKAVEPEEFMTLEKPAPVEAGPGKIEVVEFFWYSCPHCNRFEPQFEAWVAKAGKDVVVRRAPVSFRPDFEPQQRLYYVLEAMGKVDELHKKVFYAVHIEKQPLNTPALIADWIAKQGVDKAKFMEIYSSFPVNTKARRASQLQEMYRVDGVPSLGVAGRFFTSGALAGSMERALVVTDYLIAQARKA